LIGLYFQYMIGYLYHLFESPGQSGNTSSLCRELSTDMPQRPTARPTDQQAHLSAPIGNEQNAPRLFSLPLNCARPSNAPQAGCPSQCRRLQRFHPHCIDAGEREHSAQMRPLSVHGCPFEGGRSKTGQASALISRLFMTEISRALQGRPKMCLGTCTNDLDLWEEPIANRGRFRRITA
jgi:hypothetical protein